MEPTTPINAPALTDSSLAIDAQVDEAVHLYNLIVEHRDRYGDEPALGTLRKLADLHVRQLDELIGLLMRWQWIGIYAERIVITRVTERLQNPIVAGRIFGAINRKERAQRYGTHKRRLLIRSSIRRLDNQN
jgi:hypothetical protein